jgi:hypothetical protein
MEKSVYSSVGMATRLRAGRLGFWGSIPGEVWEVSSSPSRPDLVLGPNQPPVQWVPGALSLSVKRPGRDADHSPPSSAEFKECVELYPHSPNTTSWRGAQLKKAQGQLYLLPL